MTTISKIVSRQDADFKFSPSKSNETSINLSTEISDFLAEESGEITFTIYKSDFVKAMGVICLIPKVFFKKSEEPATVNEIYNLCSQQIANEFGNQTTVTYTVNLFKREDGRHYLNNLKQANGFYIRAFLVEQLSELTFEKSDDGSFALRLETKIPAEAETVDVVETHDEIEPKNEPLQLIYYGAPGTGKSFTIDKMAKDENSVRTTFHPDTDYASFVGAYKPTMEAVRIHAITGKDVTFARGEGGHPGTEKKIVYKYVPQAFLKAYVAAWKNLDEPFYLVIEEINRGNCAQIFGDLFQLLDRNNMGCSSYPINADEDIRQFLATDDNGFGNLTEEQCQRISDFVLRKDNDKVLSIGPEILSGEKLLLPPNLRIWATMNTSDQSLFPIDSAFKRRWNWKYMPIAYDRENWRFEVDGNLYMWGDFLHKINPIIARLTESSDKQMGYYFAKADPKTGIISEEVFLNKVLFYLWTDVLKDYSVGEKEFINPDTKKPYAFTDFFNEDGTPSDSVGKFITSGLELTPVVITEDEEEEEEMPDEYGNATDEGNRDLTKYTVNGEGQFNKTKAALRALEIYASKNPGMNAAEVAKNWNALETSGRWKNLVETTEEFEKRTEGSKDIRIMRRVNPVALQDGETVYITTQFNKYRMTELIEKINSMPWGIVIKPISE